MYKLPNIVLSETSAVYLVDPNVIDDYYLEHHSVRIAFDNSIQKAPFLMVVTTDKEIDNAQ